MSGFVYADRGQNSPFASNNAECPMKKLLRFLSIVLLLVGAALFLERPAYAYADPGTGLLAIQAVGSALVATGWYLRQKIFALLHRGSSSKPESAAKSDEGSADK
jgi:hypothetical protein